MITSIPSTLRLHVVSLRPHLTLTEIQLVDGALHYQRIDGRDYVPIEVRALRPSPADWADLRNVLEESRLWSWPRRWPPVHNAYEGEFVIAVASAERVARSAGPIGVAPEVDAVLDEVRRLVGNGPQLAQEPVPTLLSPTRPPPYRLDLLGDADHGRATRLP